MKDYLGKIQKNLRKSRQSFIVLVLFFLLGNILSLALIINRIVLSEVEKNTIATIPFSVPKPAPYPILHENATDITAKAAVIIDDSSKVVLFEKNQNLRFSMASTTKIMTALVALEHFALSDILTVKTENVQGAVVGFKEGEQVRFEDVLYAMLLPSGNDAALAIAQNYPGGPEIFVAKMNEKAKSLNLFSTHFADPAGLDDEGDYTTVIDLARLSSSAMQNDVIARIVATQRKNITTINTARFFTLVNINKLLGVDGVIGVKTGFTDTAGGVLATAKNEGNHRLIIVVMKSDDRFLDTKKLLTLVSGNVIYESNPR